MCRTRTKDSFNLFLEFKQPKAPYKSKRTTIYTRENLNANNNCNFNKKKSIKKKNQGSNMLKALI